MKISFILPAHTHFFHIISQSNFVIESIINLQKAAANHQTYDNPESHISGSNSERSVVHMKYLVSSKNLHMWTCLHQSSPAAVETPAELMT